MFFLKVVGDPNLVVQEIEVCSHSPSPFSFRLYLRQIFVAPKNFGKAVTRSYSGLTAWCFADKRLSFYSMKKQHAMCS